MHSTQTDMKQSIVRVLLVDSDYQQYVRLVQWLGDVQHTDYAVDWCAEPALAGAAALANPCDVILLGCTPADCATRLQILAESRCTAPIITLIDEDGTTFDAKAISNGAADYLRRSRIDSSLLSRTIRYVIQQAQAQQAIVRQSQYDALTGIPNRLLFNDRLNHAIHRARRDQGRLALFFIDFDNFKQVNDSYGHASGDLLLHAAVQRLQGVLRQSDTLARIGGDEFALLAEKFGSLRDVIKVARKLITALTRPFMINGHLVQIGCSSGIALYSSANEDSGADSGDLLLRHADLAMYRAKHEKGGNTFVFYTRKMHREHHARIELQNDLRHAIRAGQLRLFYQPKVNIETGTIMGMEALIRWQHPRRGMVSPAEFIPLAEETALINPIGYWVIYQACEDLKRFDAEGLPPLRVAVNVSFQQFLDPHFVERTSLIIQESGIDPARIELELTETAVMNNFEKTRACMQALSQLGCSFSLDDFGTGFSSFMHLRRLPIHAVKIDRSFVAAVNDSNDDAVIVSTMINMAHSLGLEVVAEGVETPAQLGFLEHYRCDLYQGYLCSQPLPPDRFSDLLLQQDHARRGT